MRFIYIDSPFHQAAVQFDAFEMSLRPVYAIVVDEALGYQSRKGFSGAGQKNRRSLVAVPVKK